MTIETALEIVDPGLGVSLQDLGRRGWKRFGVPPGGALDDHAARWANLLLGNPLNEPVLEILLHGACLRARCRLEIALTGAIGIPGRGAWCTRSLEPGEDLVLPPPAAGLWTYLATPGGFLGPRWFGSVSIFPRGGLGEPLTAGVILHRPVASVRLGSSAIGRRWVDPGEQRDYAHPPPLRVWRGPQWDLFPESSRAAFLNRPWRISARSDRTGYRLEGEPLAVPDVSLPSEPVLPGSIQVPPDGQPIVTLRDGPTVGGYPKLGVIDPQDLAWFVQCRPGQFAAFTIAEVSTPAVLPPPVPPSAIA